MDYLSPIVEVSRPARNWIHVERDSWRELQKLHRGKDSCSEGSIDRILLVNLGKECSLTYCNLPELSKASTTISFPDPASCPFDQWWLDIVGPIPLGPSQRKFSLLAVDYFSKWLKAEVLAWIIERVVLTLLLKNIVCRYRVSRRLVCDNGRQF